MKDHFLKYPAGLLLWILAACHSDGHRGIEPTEPGGVPYVLAGGLPVPTWRTEDYSLVQSLDGPWRFLEDPDVVGEARQWYSPEIDRSGWRTIKVPGVWNAAFPDLLDYEGVGWYATEFDVTGGPTADNMSRDT